MANINHFTGVGRLTANAELKYTTSGTACVKFSICIKDSYKKGDQWEEKPNFFNCVVWGKYGEAMQKHLTKGKRVGIEAKLRHNPWTDNSGGKHNDVTLVINNLMLLDAPKGEASSPAPAAPAQSGNPGSGEPPADDIPF
jgi:single-strand DNA-binding protein